jgi:fibronectin-binding autotransporter adhesin
MKAEQCIADSNRPGQRASWRSVLGRLLLILLVAVGATDLHATTRTWQGGAGGNVWSHPNNWVPFGVPQEGDTLQFTGPSFQTNSHNDLVSLRLATIVFSGTDGFWLTGNPVRLEADLTANHTGSRNYVHLGVEWVYGGGVISTANSGQLEVSGNIILAGGQLQLNCINADLTLSGAIQGDGEVIKFGERALTFAGSSPNTFTGPLEIRRGTNFLAKTAGVTAVPGNLVVGPADLVSGHGTVIWQNAHQVADTGTNIIFNGHLNLNGWSDGLGMIQADSGLITTAGGTLTLLGNLRHRWQEFFTLFSIEGTLFLPEDRTIACEGFGTLDISAAINGPGGFTLDGGGYLAVSGTNNFSGPVVINLSRLTARHRLSLGTHPVLTLNDHAELVLATPLGDPPGFSGAVNKTLVVNSPTSWLTFSRGDWTWEGNIQLNFDGLLPFSVREDAHATVTGSIQGPGGIWFGGAGEIEIKGNNTYVGLTRVANRLLTVNNGMGKPFSDQLEAGGTYLTRFMGPDANPTTEIRWLTSLVATHQNVELQANALLNLNGYSKNISNLTFNGGRITNSGFGSLGLSGTVTVNSNTISARISSDVLLSPGERVFQIANGSVTPDLVINGNLSEPGVTAGLTKRGSGELWLNGANTYTGDTLVEGGVLVAQTAGALGTAANGTMVSDGATLEVGATINLNEPLTLVGNGRFGTSGALHLRTAAGVSASIHLAGPTSIRVNENFSTLSGVIGGTGGLTKLGAGSLQLGGGAGTANTYSGDTLVDDGVLVLFKPAGVAAVPGDLIIGRGGLGSPASTARNFNSDQVGGGVTVRRGGLYDLNNHNEGFALGALGGQPPLTLIEGGSVHTGTGTLTLPGGTDIAVFVNPGAGALGGLTSTIHGRLALANGTHTFHVGPDGIGLGSGPALNIPGQVLTGGGVNEIVKNGAGSMRLAGNNTFNGLLTVNEGRVIGGSSLAFGNNLASTFVTSNAAVALEGGLNVTETFLMSSSAQPALYLLNGNTTVGGVIQLNQDTHLGVEEAAARLTHGDAMSGVGRLIKTGPGTLNMSNNIANFYTGETVVLGGLLEVTKPINVRGIPGHVSIGDHVNPPTNATVRVTAAGPLAPTAIVQVNQSGLFQSALPGGGNLVIGGLAGAGLASIVSGSALTLSNNAAVHFAGSLLSPAGTLNKLGSGTQRFSGNSPAFFGTLNLSNGVAKVDGRMTNCAVVYYDFATLSGDGAVGNFTGGGSLFGGGLGGYLQPDSGSPARRGGDLEVGNLGLDALALFVTEFFGPNETGGNNTVIARGSVSLGASFLTAELIPSFAYPPREGDVITVIRKDSAGAITGTFNGWPEGITRQVGHVAVRASYLGGDGNDFTLTVTNVPLAATGYRLEEGNGNQTVEPDECNLLYLSLVNRRTNSLTLTNVLLRSLTPGVLVTIAGTAYPVIPAGESLENLTPFQFRTDPALPCGSAVELELVFGVAEEGPFALTFSPVSGNDCTQPTGPCGSCHVVYGEFTPDTPIVSRRIKFTGAPSICDPPKLCPEYEDGTPTRYLTHSLTNSTTNALCLTVVLQAGCPAPTTLAFSAGAYLGAFDVNDPCAGYLGDAGLSASPERPFSFRVPPATNFVLVVAAKTTGDSCESYALEIFGLPCPPPVLAIAPESDPNQVRVHWSTAYPGWTAQQAGTPTGSFSAVPQLPAIVNGRYALTNLTTTTNQFYRLTK